MCAMSWCFTNYSSGDTQIRKSFYTSEKVNNNNITMEKLKSLPYRYLVANSKNIYMFVLKYAKVGSLEVAHVANIKLALANYFWGGGGGRGVGGGGVVGVI